MGIFSSGHFRWKLSVSKYRIFKARTYSTKLISLHLLHELDNLRNGHFKAFFGRTRDMKVERRVLFCTQRIILDKISIYQSLTAAVAMLLSG
jgi:hypothetical protein